MKVGIQNYSKSHIDWSVRAMVSNGDGGFYRSMWAFPFIKLKFNLSSAAFQKILTIMFHKQILRFESPKMCKTFIDKKI